MKTHLIAACVLTLASGVLVADSKPRHPLMKSDTVVWAGLDYSLVHMFGTDDFRKPEIIFPDMLDKWNARFVSDWVGRTEQALRKQVIVDVEGIAARNRLATTNQIIRMNPGRISRFAPAPFQYLADTAWLNKPMISQTNIAEAVRSYQLSSERGLGLVFIVDRLVKRTERGWVYVVFFDVATREVISSEYRGYQAGGAGFQNHWFTVIKEAAARLKRYR
jgi:hypothetical protein